MILPETEPRPIHYLIIDVDRAFKDDYELGCFVSLKQDGHDHQYMLVSMFEVDTSIRLVLSPFTQDGPVTIRRTKQSKFPDPEFKTVAPVSARLRSHYWERHSKKRTTMCSRCLLTITDDENQHLTTEQRDHIWRSECPGEPVGER